MQKIFERSARAIAWRSLFYFTATLFAPRNSDDKIRPIRAVIDKIMALVFDTMVVRKKRNVVRENGKRYAQVPKTEAETKK